MTPPECASGELDDFARAHGCRLEATLALPRLTHSFTHFRLHIDALVCRVEQTRAAAVLAMEPRCQWLAYEEIEAAALPTPIRALLRTLRKTQV